ncbi:MAG TPA: TIGR03435 family protein [Bryobacteraceae bacterium]|nr:TIGR03435 family protein [Bryobacteraceae bacterium]
MRTSLPGNSFRSLGLLVSLASGPLGLCAQPAAQPLRFEVISIRPHRLTGDEPSERRVFPGGRFVATATTVRTLLRMAFGADDRRMSGAPGWADSEAFDITAATADHAEIENPQQLQQLLVSLLEERFRLKFHREQKPGFVYWLERDRPGRLGPTLKPSTPESQPNLSTDSNGAKAIMRASKMSMADVAAALSRQTGHPVEDHTGLHGSFDFEIEWAPEETPDSVDPSLNTVLKEQLGLRLRPVRGTVEVLVIDRIARPSEN